MSLVSRPVLAEGAIMVSIAIVLDLISTLLPSLPQGGSVTLGAMVPLLLFAIRRGYVYGIAAGMLFSIVTLAFRPPFIVSPIQFLLDYPLAFGALGLAGIFSSNVIAATFVGIFGRFLAHFISGIVWFGEYAPEGTPVAVYSAVYNGSYLGIEFITSTILLYIILKRNILEIK
ncbi:MAG: energy-coupled thiamine transporter ThiT [Nitrososphaerales archaeon]